MMAEQAVSLYVSEEPGKRFNPREHLMQIKNKNGSNDYLAVQWRLVWFREQCPEGTIETELIQLDLDRETEEETYAWNQETRRSEKVIKMARGYALFKAVVKDGKGGVATGYKSEKAASFPDFIEKAETGSIGRALAGLGYGTQFAPELNEDHRIVDAPVETRQHTETEREKYQQRKPFVEGTVVTESKEKPAPEPQANGHQDADKSTVAVTRGDLYSRGEAKGLWSRTSPDKFYAWASSISARPQSKNAWDMTISEMGEMAKRIYAEPAITK